MEAADLLETYYGARRNKRRSKDSVLFEFHFERNIASLVRQINAHTFKPSAYTFIVDRPRPREIFACEMGLRICDHYLDDRLRCLLENRMTDRSFNNRIGYGTIAAINSAISDIYDVTQGFRKDAWIIKLDLKGYFPNAVQEIAYNQLAELVESDYEGADKPDVHYLLQRCIYSYPVENCERRSPRWMWDDYPQEKSLFSKPVGIGGAIGRLIWQVAMGYYLNDLDKYLVEECGLHYTRFVDDMFIVTDNKESTLAMIPEIRSRLAELGCTLHPKKFYCQHYSKGAEFLGAIIKRDRVYVSYRTVRNMKKAIHHFNRRVRLSQIEPFMSSMNSYLGILKSRNAYRITCQMIDRINPAWWKFCHFNKERQCIQANPGFTHIELLARRYNLKFKKLKKNNHGNERRNRGSGGKKD